MSHHAHDASEPWEYDWAVGLEAMIFAMSASLKDNSRFKKYLYESEIAGEKKGAPLQIEKTKAICQKSKDDLEHELGVECICQGCWAILQMKGAADKNFKNAEVKETKVENKKANRKLGEVGRGGFNTIIGGSTVSSKGAANEVTNSPSGHNIHSDLTTSNGTNEENFTK
ncbi:uncharacterized protein EAF01_011689 [Botrytis porri]|uniref:Uncharacterized protein n=1 Tax=Botrytis porri TaxID=87229 RepID=A0A4Z1KMX3_9HELO|nr:uncharacterized protein EAF01_011689 [Botrytis porri]KAF7883180.1 hypothetical protein EAF01_011689 [Botrytis porri]TGO86830.1 hypothetical protein BPOR_0273g00090 [Botrytis porri]